MDRYTPLRLMLSLAVVGGIASISIWSFLGLGKWALPLVFVAGGTIVFCVSILVIGLFLIHLDRKVRRTELTLHKLGRRHEKR